jgi:hypothetical protein
MSCRLLLSLLATLTLAFAPAPFPRMDRGRPDPQKVDRLYPTLGGMWQASEANAPLDYLWLHKGEKARPRKGESPWRLSFYFQGKQRERYDDAPARLEAEGAALKITLRPTGRRGQPGTRVLRIRKAGDRLLVRVNDGAFKGTYLLKRAPSKH